MNRTISDMTSLPAIVELPLCNCCDHEAENGFCWSKDHWNYALGQIRQAQFSSTSASIDPPMYHFMNYEKRKKHKVGIERYNISEITNRTYQFDFNSDPFAAKDIFTYRQLRSEHILIRIAHNLNRNDRNSFIRLSRGIFLVQQTEPSQEVPTMNNLDFLLQDSFDSVDTLSFNLLYNEMMQQTEKPFEISSSFTPYTYTLGTRYTNPYQDTRDIVIRGKIPLWCQTLFITECMRQLPILPGSKIKGLLPFLKDMEFEFKALSHTRTDLYPELAVIFEKFAMEVSDPHMIWENQDLDGNKWQDVRNRILENIVYCDLSQEQANTITGMANRWAISQGILLK